METLNTKNYAMCDNAIAIAKEELNVYSIIHIHQILTKHDAGSGRNEGQEIGNDSYKINTAVTKKLRYSKHPMDINYSSRFMSLSKGGHYFAISWLPNPRLGPGVSMKYCMIYDLSVLPYDSEVYEDQDMPVTFPMRLLEFYGGCSFTAYGDLVLINQNEVRIYNSRYDIKLEVESFDLAFSLNLSSTNASLSPYYNYDNMPPTYFLFPLMTDGSTNVVEQVKSPMIKPEQSSNQTDNCVLNKKNHVTSNIGTESFDDIFIKDQDDEQDEQYSEQDGEQDEEENNIFDEQDVYFFEEQDDIFFDERNDIFYGQDQDDLPSGSQGENNSQSDTQEPHANKTKNTSDQLSENILPALFKSFDNNDQFIKMNIDNIKLSSVICCISPSFQKTDSETQKNNLLVWSLNSKKLIYFKQLDDDSQYLTAFTEKNNLIAVAKKYNENYDITRLIKKPVVDVYDCDSGITVVQLSLPQDRLIAGVSQISFLQKDNYIMTVSYSLNMCLIDIWDTGTGIHLDCFETQIDNNKVSAQDSQFVLHDAIQLRYGCGVFIRAEHPTLNNSPPPESESQEDSSQKNLSQQNYISIGSKHLFLQRISFFDSCYDHSCICGSTKFWRLAKSSKFQGKHTLYRRKDKMSIPTLINEGLGWPAYFLNEKETYLMTCTQKRSNVRDTFTMTVWDVTPDQSCRKRGDCHDRTITLNMVVYSFIYTANYKVQVMVGYPASFLDLRTAIRKCITHINPIIVNPPNASGTPILLMKINDTHEKTNYSMVIEQQGYTMKPTPYTIAVPLHMYSLLECRLHILANGNMTINYSYQSFAHIPALVTGKNNLKMTLQHMINSIDGNSGYFATLTGYSALCRLVQHDTNYNLLQEVFKTTTRINYCSIAVQQDGNYYVTDVLQEALLSKATKNAKLIVSHLKNSVAISNFANGSLLIVKNHSLLVDNGINIADIF